MTGIASASNAFRSGTAQWSRPFVAGGEQLQVVTVARRKRAAAGEVAVQAAVWAAVGRARA
jgi:hypothetical protein